MLDDAAQLQAAVGVGRDLGGDQYAVEFGDVGRNRLGVRVRGVDDVCMCYGRKTASLREQAHPVEGTPVFEMRDVRRQNRAHCKARGTL